MTPLIDPFLLAHAPPLVPSSSSSLSHFDCSAKLKTLGVVLKNLIDPTKGGSSSGDDSSKYRTLKLDNAKLQTRLFCVPYIQELLVSPLVGFEVVGNTLTMLDPPSPSTVDLVTQQLLPAIARAETVVVLLSETTAASNKKAKFGGSSGSSGSLDASSSSVNRMSEKQRARMLLEEKERDEREQARAARKVTEAQIAADKKVRMGEDGSSSGGAGSIISSSSLSEKQRARMLMEEKERNERENARAARKMTEAQIAADKKVRMEDENWKPCVSAAAAKTGTGMLTFRDRHGE